MSGPPGAAGVALVTGSARRLGRAMAVALAEDGFDLGLHVRTIDDDARSLLALVEGLGRRAVLAEGDLSDPAAPAAIAGVVHAALGPVTLLVNNAAGFARDRLADLAADGFDRQIATNLRAPLLLARGVASALPDDRRGLIVNLLDSRIFRPTRNYLSYTVAKAGLEAATRVLALDLAPRIRVCGIAPGIPLPEAAMGEARHRRLLERTPLGRAGSVEEIVAALRYLVASPSVTGEVLTIDGGMRLIGPPLG